MYNVLHNVVIPVFVIEISNFCHLFSILLLLSSNIRQKHHLLLKSLLENDICASSDILDFSLSDDLL